MEAWKGHGQLIAALHHLRDRDDWVCWIAGGAQRPAERTYEAQLHMTAAPLGDRCRFLGQRDDVPELMARADIYCQPNTGPEPFGLSLVEALSAGLPVVSSRLGAAPEIVDASCGVLVEPGNTAELAKELAGLLDDAARREHLARGGPVRARALCDPSQQIPALTDVLVECASRRMLQVR